MPIVDPNTLNIIGARDFHLNTNYYNWASWPNYVAHYEYSPATQAGLMGWAVYGTQDWYDLLGFGGVVAEIWTLDMPFIETVMARAYYPVRHGTIECIKTFNC
jgi:hypothetical protein